jgi:hypothetical protein
MEPGIYNFPPHYRGDTFTEVVFTINENGSPVDLTGAAIRMEFRKNSLTGDLEESMSIGSGLSLKSDGSDGTFVVDSFINNWDAGTYYYDTEVTFPDATVRTYFKGYQAITQDTSNV